MSDPHPTHEDDPTLTAYALNELEADAAAGVAARLEHDPAAAAHVAAVRRDAATLTAALRSEPEPAAVLERRRRRWPVALAAAATLAAVGLTTWALWPELDRGAANAPTVAIIGQAEQSTNEAVTSAAEGLLNRLREPAELQATQSAAAQSASRRDALGRLAKDAEAAADDGNLQAETSIRDQMATIDPSLQQQQQGQQDAETLDYRPLPAAAKDKLAAPAAAAAAPTANSPARFYSDALRYPDSWPDLTARQRGLPADGPAEAAGLGVHRAGAAETEFNTEAYDRVVDNPFLRVADHPLSTFSADVDTASYSNVRRFLDNGQLPPPDAVRIEEMVNYFDYAYAPPADGDPHPFVARVAVASAPWAPTHRLVRIGIKAKEVSAAERKPSNLVFLLDVSGSMDEPNKLPLVKRSMKLLVEKLAADWLANEGAAGQPAASPSRISIVVYAGASGVALPPTQAADKQTIFNAIDTLQPGGSTNGAAGIELAYNLAQKQFIKDGVNRVILCTDGDFNVGVTDQGGLTRLVEDKAKSGVYLSVLGFGMGNLKDATMEELTNKGEGNYAYVDTEAEARKVLVEQMAGTLQAVAKDVKLQVEFNPAEVSGYRLIGYENRVLAKEAFNDDTKDAGDVGAGHEVTALYEVVPAAVSRQAGLDAERTRADLRRQIEELTTALAKSDQTAAVQDALREKLAALRQAQATLPEPSGDVTPAPKVDDLRYQQKPEPAVAAAASGELLTLKLRYKQPDAPKEQGTSTLIEFPVTDAGTTFDAADADFKFAANVAAFGMLLRDSPYKGTLTWAGLENLDSGQEARSHTLRDMGAEGTRRAEFYGLVRKAAQLAGNR